MDRALLDTDTFSEILKRVDGQVVTRAVQYRLQFGVYTISTIRFSTTCWLRSSHSRVERRRRAMRPSVSFAVLENQRAHRYDCCGRRNREVNDDFVLQSIFSDEELRSRFSDSLLFFARIQELNQVVERARTHICALTVDHYRSPPDDRFCQQARSFYRALLEQYRHLELFTTNYDLVPEYLLSSNSWCKERCQRCKELSCPKAARPPTDAAQKRKSSNDGILDNIEFLNGVQEFETGGADRLPWARQTYEITHGGRSSVSVFRLHGCVGWYYDEDAETSVIYFDPHKVDDIKNPYDRLCVMYPGKDQLVGCDPHAYSFERLYDACLTSQAILFVGFSFRDADVASAIFGAIRQRRKHDPKSPPTRLIVVDPDIDADYLRQRLDSQKNEIAIPLALESSDLEIVAIRSEFPPTDPAVTKSILRALDIGLERRDAN